MRCPKCQMSVMVLEEDLHDKWLNCLVCGHNLNPDGSERRRAPEPLAAPIRMGPKYGNIRL